MRRGGDYDRWDFQVSGGLWGAVRGRMTIEEHGGGKQMVRYRSWPLIKVRGWLVLAVFVGLSMAAAIAQAWPAAAVLGLAAMVAAGAAFADCAAATAFWSAALEASAGGSSYVRTEPAFSAVDLSKRSLAAAEWMCDDEPTH